MLVIQIAFLIVTRGYQMAPASPPLECVHVWYRFLKSPLKKVICNVLLLLEVCITCFSSQMLITLINMFKKIYTALGLYNHTRVIWP